MSDLYPEVIDNCHVQETPRMEFSTSADKQLIDMREQALICFLERGALNMALGDNLSSNLNHPYKDLFQSLRTEFSANVTRMTQEITCASRLAIQRCTHELAADSHEKTMASTTRGADATALAEIVADQATPKVLKNGRAILLIVGETPPKKWAKAPQLVEWETLSSDSQTSPTTNFLERGLIPFVNLHPQGETQREKTKSGVALFRTCLQVLRPLMILCLGGEVGDIVTRAFPSKLSNGIGRREVFSHVGKCSIRDYPKGSEHSSEDQVDCCIQLTSYHPGALAQRSVALEAMRRVMYLTMMKAWLGMSEVLKYSEEDLDSLQVCAKLNKDIEGRLATTTWNTDLQHALKEIKAIQEEQRRNADESAASKALRKSEALQINVPSPIKRCDKAKTQIRNNDQRPKNPSNTQLMVSPLAQRPLDSTNSNLPLPPVTIPLFEKSYYEGRQLIFKMSYSKDSNAAAAIQKLKNRFPLQRGDLLWLLDQFLLQEYPNGGTINCADPSAWPNAASVWPQISRFCTTSEFSQHPFAEHLHKSATNASNGTYTAMQVIVSLKAALEALRTNVVKKSYMKMVMVLDKGIRQQRRFTTFVLNATCPDGFRQS